MFDGEMGWVFFISADVDYLLFITVDGLESNLISAYIF